MELRDYQQRAVEAVWTDLAYQAGNPLLVMPTGSGKSPVIGSLCKTAVERYHARIIVLAHRKELLEQNADKIRSFLPAMIPVGLYSAGLRRYATDEHVICAGIQSIYNKAELLGARSLVIIDEAHLVPEDGEGMYQKFLCDLRAINPKLRIVGLTATPFRTGSGNLCRPDAIFQRVCHEVPVKELIDAGWLCPLVSSSGEASIDTTKLHIRGGEFKQDEAERLFDSKVVAACEEIAKKTAGRKSILIFCQGVSHAEHVSECLERITGSEVGLVVGSTPALEREATLRAFREQRLRFCVNVDVLCLDEKTEILCSDGWIGIDEMTKDKKVACWDDGKIHFAQPKTIVRRHRIGDERFVSLKSNAVDIRVTENHKMIYKTRRGWEKMAAGELVGKVAKLPCHGIAERFDVAIPDDVGTAKKMNARIRSLTYVYKTKYKLSSEDARELARKNTRERYSMRSKTPRELTNEECELIGFWVGDGSFSGGRVTLQQSFAYQDNIERVDYLLMACGITHSRKIYKPANKTKNRSVRWTLARGTGGIGQKTAGGYFKIEKYLDKNGSDLLWGLSKDQFISFLRGWNMADGLHHAKHKGKNRIRVACANKVLLDKIQAIATCRELRTSLSTSSPPRRKNHSQMWSLSVCNSQTIATAWKRFEFSEWKKGERCWCVTSETGNIVIRRNGKVSVVGNTTGFDAPVIDAIAVLRATMSPGLFAQMVGRGLRLSPVKQDCLVLDFGENVGRHGKLDDPMYGRRKKKDLELAGEAVEKQCPNCHTMVPGGSAECSCGYQFPEREEQLRHNKHAGDEALIGYKSEPEWFNVEAIEYTLHKPRDPMKPASMKVSYSCKRDTGTMYEVISEWVCIEHEGFARRKACLWWSARSETPAPTSIEDAIELANTLDEWREPKRLRAHKEGKFWKIDELDMRTREPSFDFGAAEEKMPF